jgi:hypothetical protein
MSYLLVVLGWVRVSTLGLRLQVIYAFKVGIRSSITDSSDIGTVGPSDTRTMVVRSPLYLIQTNVTAISS